MNSKSQRESDFAVARPLQVLIIDDEETFGRSLAMLLERRSAHVQVATDGTTGLRILKNNPCDIVLLDHVLPDCRGLDLITSILAARPVPLVLMMTAYGTVDDAVEAMRRGAHDYIAKTADVRRIVERVLRSSVLVESRRRAVSLISSHPPLLGASQAMADVRHRLNRVSRSLTTTVLLTGESGTGKELAARTLHAIGRHPNAAFIAVDCVSLPATLAESELFGHERGAFTGAEKTRFGKLETAGQGTVLLDEIGDMDLGLQAKLLRVLENRTMTRIGGQKPIALEARVVAATNSDLSRRVAEGRFRLDLFHRLSVFQLTMPPLRDRREDIPILIEHFIRELAVRLERPHRQISTQARELLTAYDYPGNVRELRNILEQALIMCETNQVEADHLPDRLRELQGYIPSVSSEHSPDSIVLEFVPERDTLGGLEEHLINEAMKRTGGRITSAAKMLGLSRFALARRLEKYKSAKRKKGANR